MWELVQRFRQDEAGATAIEYALIASFIGMAIVSVVTQIGVNLKTTFTTVNNGLSH